MNWNKEQAPDSKPGNYYVTAIDGGRVYLMAGPFMNAHWKALCAVRTVKEAAEEIDGRASFMAWGTSRFEETVTTPGRLNSVVL